MKLKNILIALLAIIVAFTAVGCGSPTFNSMKDDIKTNGTHDAKNEKYEIALTSKIDYYFFDDSDNIWLSYHDYSSGSSTSFYIAFDEELSGDYSWTFDWDDYTLRGEVYAATFTQDRTYLFYDDDKSEDSSSVLVNNELEKLAATILKTCLLSLKAHWIKTGSDLTLASIGFTDFE